MSPRTMRLTGAGYGNVDSERNHGGFLNYTYYTGLDVHKKTISYCVATTFRRGAVRGACLATRSRGSSGQLGQLLKLSFAVAELLGRNTHLVEQRQLEVRQRRVVRIDDVTAALERPGASAQK